MSLSLAFDIARSSLSTNADRASIASRNIEAANDPSATRKSAELIRSYGGGVRLGSIERTVDARLAHSARESNTQVAQHQAVLSGLNELNQIVGQPGDGVSPTEQLSRLQNNLAAFAAAPQDHAAAQATLATATNLVGSLNDSTRLVERVRSTADADIGRAVSNLNQLLSDFEAVNDEIVNGTLSNRDVTDQQDRRDSILADISNIVGVRTIARENDDLVIMTEGGLTLFETNPRSIVFQPSGVLTAGVSGGSVSIDGVEFSQSGSFGGSESGSLVGLLALRDEIAPAVQNQLDEIARGLVTSFAESDQTGGGAPDQPGLFTYAGAAGVPAGGTIVPGLAGIIAVNDNVNPDAGGNIWLLRNGAISDPLGTTYLYNTTGSVGFSDRLDQLSQALQSNQSFDVNANLETSTDLMSFADQSIAWISQQRSERDSQLNSASALATTAQEALSRATGVNLDEEMLLMLEVERSYQATARLMTTIDQMFNELFAAVR
ncbi:MAG: flagellar hook-associated protein FlgK [Pseudomonadota bacterium]